MKKIISNITMALAFGAVAVFSSGCTDDLVNNGITPKTPLDASFVITPLSSSPNRFILTPSNEDYIFSEWDLDDGANYIREVNKYQIFLPDAGTYNIKHRVVGVGAASAVATQTVVVATSDPNAGNLVEGGKFASAEDISKWTVDNLTGGVCTFDNGWVTFTNTPESWGQAALQQPIEVVAGKTYQIDMVFKTAGVKNGWFKVYACTTKPTPGVEYGGSILVAEIPIWGDNVGPLSGKFSSILNPSSGTQTGNKVTFSTSGTIYLSIQCGAADLKAGVSITNVEFRGVSE